MPIRLRLALYGAVVTALAMGGFGALLLAGARASAPDEQAAALAALAERVVNQLEADPTVELPGAPPIAAVDLETDPDPFVAVVSAAGEPLYSTAVYRGGPPAIPSSVVAEALETGAAAGTLRLDDGEEVRIEAIRWETSARPGPLVVVAGQPLRSVAEELAGLRAVIWVSATITLMAATLVSWLVAGRALRPLGRLATTTDEIGRTGDLSRRLPPVRTRDELGRLTASFNAMLDRLDTSRRELTETLEAQRRFLADASHELRSPLTTIRSNAGFLLERSDVAEDDRRETIADIAAEADRMAELTDRLLALARAESSPPAERKPVSMAELADAVVGRAARTGVEITADLDGPGVVLGDPSDLERLLWILVDNARRHGDEPIEVCVHHQRSEVVVEVADRGPGVPPAHRTRIFERFYRADPARSGDGVGLGLAMAKAIVTAHGGSIDAAERAGGGARFLVRLPGTGS